MNSPFNLDIVTIFPEVCQQYLNTSVIGRAQKKGLVQVNVHNLRDFSPDKKHHRVDDTPYGGGPGMIMRVEPFDRALAKLKKQRGKRTRVILTSAGGKKFTQADARRLSAYDRLIFLCGRYEGIDARVEKYLADESLSIGDYVLTGGELPALVMSDAVIRLIPGVLGSRESLTFESHTTAGFLEYPQYTKPEVYVFRSSKKTKIGKAKVPAVLLSGHHQKIAAWRSKHTKKQLSRPYPQANR